MEWVAMPFGMCIALATFQRMMNDILRDYLHMFVNVYLYDVCAYCRTLKNHVEDMRMALHRFKEEGSKLRLKKCFFGKRGVEYLSYNVPAPTISVSTKKVGRRRLASVSTQKEVCSFVQFWNFNTMFIHHFSDLTAPLTDLLRKS
jgi:hypothetical protein